MSETTGDDVGVDTVRPGDVRLLPDGSTLIAAPGSPEALFRIGRNGWVETPGDPLAAPGEEGNPLLIAGASPEIDILRDELDQRSLAAADAFTSGQTDLLTYNVIDRHRLAGMVEGAPLLADWIISMVRTRSLDPRLDVGRFVAELDRPAIAAELCEMEFPRRFDPDGKATVAATAVNSHAFASHDYATMRRVLDACGSQMTAARAETLTTLEFHLLVLGSCLSEGLAHSVAKDPAAATEVCRRRAEAAARAYSIDVPTATWGFLSSLPRMMAPTSFTEIDKALKSSFVPVVQWTSLDAASAPGIAYRTAESIVTEASGYDGRLVFEVALTEMSDGVCIHAGYPSIPGRSQGGLRLQDDRIIGFHGEGPRLDPRHNSPEDAAVISALRPHLDAAVLRTVDALRGTARDYNRIAGMRGLIARARDDVEAVRQILDTGRAEWSTDPVLRRVIDGGRTRSVPPRRHRAL